MSWSFSRKLERYDTLIESVPNLQRKGKASSYTSMNGNMFSFLSPSGDLAFRLPKARRATFLERYPGAVVVQHNTVMKDYVDVPDEILEDESALNALFAEVMANAATLKPKPTNRKKKSP